LSGIVAPDRGVVRPVRWHLPRTFAWGSGHWRINDFFLFQRPDAWRGDGHSGFLNRPTFGRNHAPLLAENAHGQAAIFDRARARRHDRLDARSPGTRTTSRAVWPGIVGPAARGNR